MIDALPSRSARWSVWFAACCSAAITASACAQRDADVVAYVRPVPQHHRPQSASTQPADRAPLSGRMREIRRNQDPEQLLQMAIESASHVETARMEFERQERLGLFKSLRPAERMTALVREAPFSVLFTWLDDDSELIQCLYVDGTNKNAVMLHQRRGIFGGPGGVVAFPPDLAVVLQKAKLPITDFGPRRIMSALEARVKAAEPLGGVNLSYEGRAVVGPDDELCDHVTLRFPEGDPHAARRVELYLHARTHLPVMIELWLPERGNDPSAALDARYVFAKMEVNPTLHDSDFQLSCDRKGNDPGRTRE